MRQVIYVLGPSGSGKTTLALEFSSSAYVVHVDQLALMTAMRLCPFCNPGSAGDWELWQVLLKHTAASEALRASFLHAHAGCLSSQKPILFEGTILVWDQWRQALRAALVMAGMEVTGETLLWLDPSPDEVHRNMIIRGRGGESAKTITQVEDICRKYAGLAINPIIERYQSYNLLAQKLGFVLGSDGAVA
jgi:hypothetical protein